MRFLFVPLIHWFCSTSNNENSCRPPGISITYAKHWNSPKKAVIWWIFYRNKQRNNRHCTNPFNLKTLQPPSACSITFNNCLFLDFCASAEIRVALQKYIAFAYSHDAWDWHVKRIKTSAHSKKPPNSRSRSIYPHFTENEWCKIRLIYSRIRKLLVHFAKNSISIQFKLCFAKM